jgi:hypothetical protein
VEAGHPSLAKAAKATVQRILAEHPPHPGRIKYYLERRDPQFDEKMKNVLLVYQAVALQNEERGQTDTLPSVMTVPVDEKPGLQAIANRTGLPLHESGGRRFVSQDRNPRESGDSWGGTDGPGEDGLLLTLERALVVVHRVMPTLVESAHAELARSPLAVRYCPRPA